MLKPWVAHYEPGVPPTLEYPAVTFMGAGADGRTLSGTAGDHLLGAKLPYRTLNEAANRFAHALLNLGLEQGDRVAPMLPNCPQFLIAFYGALKAGAVVTAMNPLYTPRELEYQLNDAEAETVVTLSKFYPTVEAVRRNTALQRVIVTNIKEYLPMAQRTLFTLFKERKEGHRVSLRRDAPTHWLQGLLGGTAHVEHPWHRRRPERYRIITVYWGHDRHPQGSDAHAQRTGGQYAADPILAVGLSGRAETMLLVLPLFHVFGMGAC